MTLESYLKRLSPRVYENEEEWNNLMECAELRWENCFETVPNCFDAAYLKYSSEI